ncbi:hypothetical protein Q31a_08830 [Aureliella helgolandensis]|uniref:Tetratricopeptide repeat protein n=2 Tax=Aureliella helgolandensis TaxID=2527968 RepID=A0A518G1V9_9BACT|nr:hypothetical protein Q31a_08830 [Aureliella helgolandensis]
MMDCAVGFRALNAEFEQLGQIRIAVLEERNTAQQRLVQSNADLNGIIALGAMQTLRLAQAQYEADLATMERSSASATNVGMREDTRTIRQRRANEAVTLANAFNQGEQLKQLSAASQVTVERHLKILRQLQQLALQAQQWQANHGELFQRYIALADLTGVRSEFELKGVLRELQHVQQDNLGSQIALAVTQLRLGDFPAAQQQLSKLNNNGAAIHPLVHALQAEIRAQEGDAKGAKKMLSEAVRSAPNNPQLRWLQARNSAIEGELDRAISELQPILRLGGMDIATHRQLALVYLSQATSSSRVLDKALEHAKLASSLSGESDWCSQIALALATAHQGDLAAAADLAEKAATLALAERSDQCAAIAEELRNGKIPVWKF